MRFEVKPGYEGIVVGVSTLVVARVVVTLAYCRVTLDWLAQGAEPDSAAATPLWGLVQEAGTVYELRSRCVAPVAAGH